MSQTIEILVRPDGSTRVETKGFAGATCRDASQFVEAALGKQRTERLTDEFYRSAEASQQLRQDE